MIIVVRLTLVIVESIIVVMIIVVIVLIVVVLMIIVVMIIVVIVGVVIVESLLFACVIAAVFSIRCGWSLWMPFADLPPKRKASLLHKTRLAHMTVYNKQSRLQLTTKTKTKQQQPAILFMVVSTTLQKATESFQDSLPADFLLVDCLHYPNTSSNNDNQETDNNDNDLMKNNNQ